MGTGGAIAVEGPQIVQGGVAITQPNANQTTIDQSTDRAVINWQNFNIGPGQAVQFNQPGANSATLNRVIGNGASPTTIQGMLNANGRVFIVDPNGVVFGQGAQVNVGGLVASSMNIDQNQFMTGGQLLGFTAGTASGIVKVEAGAQITAKTFVALLANSKVSNAGEINAGTDATAQDRGIAMVASDAATIRLGNFTVQVDKAAQDAMVANSGSLVIGESQIDGSILLNAAGRNALMQTLLSNSGTITNGSRGSGSLTSLDSGGGLSHTGKINALAGKVELHAPEIAIDGDVTVGDDKTRDPVIVEVGDDSTQNVRQGLGSTITASSQTDAQINVAAQKTLTLQGELIAPGGEISLKSTILDTSVLIPLADRVLVTGVEVWAKLPLTTEQGLVVYLGKDGQLYSSDGRRLEPTTHLYDEQNNDVGVAADVHLQTAEAKAHEAPSLSKNSGAKLTVDRHVGPTQTVHGIGKTSGTLVWDADRKMFVWHVGDGRILAADAGDTFAMGAPNGTRKGRLVAGPDGKLMMVERVGDHDELLAWTAAQTASDPGVRVHRLLANNLGIIYKPDGTYDLSAGGRKGLGLALQVEISEGGELTIRFAHARNREIVKGAGPNDIRIIDRQTGKSVLDAVTVTSIPGAKGVGETVVVNAKHQIINTETLQPETKGALAGMKVFEVSGAGGGRQSVIVDANNHVQVLGANGTLTASNERISLARGPHGTALPVLVDANGRAVDANLRADTNHALDDAIAKARKSGDRELADALAADKLKGSFLTRASVDAAVADYNDAKHNKTLDGINAIDKQLDATPGLRARMDRVLGGEKGVDSVADLVAQLKDRRLHEQQKIQAFINRLPHASASDKEIVARMNASIYGSSTAAEADHKVQSQAQHDLDNLRTTGRDAKATIIVINGSPFVVRGNGAALRQEATQAVSKAIAAGARILDNAIAKETDAKLRGALREVRSKSGPMSAEQAQALVERERQIAVDSEIDSAIKRAATEASNAHDQGLVDALESSRRARSFHSAAEVEAAVRSYNATKTGMKKVADDIEFIGNLHRADASARSDAQKIVSGLPRKTLSDQAIAGRMGAKNYATKEEASADLAAQKRAQATLDKHPGSAIVELPNASGRGTHPVVIDGQTGRAIDSADQRDVDQEQVEANRVATAAAGKLQLDRFDAEKQRLGNALLRDMKNGRFRTRAEVEAALAEYDATLKSVNEAKKAIADIDALDKTLDRTPGLRARLDRMSEKKSLDEVRAMVPEQIKIQALIDAQTKSTDPDAHAVGARMARRDYTTLDAAERDFRAQAGAQQTLGQLRRSDPGAKIVELGGRPAVVSGSGLLTDPEYKGARVIDIAQQGGKKTTMVIGADGSVMHPNADGTLSLTHQQAVEIAGKGGQVRPVIVDKSDPARHIVDVATGARTTHRVLSMPAVGGKSVTLIIDDNNRVSQIKADGAFSVTDKTIVRLVDASGHSQNLIFDARGHVVMPDGLGNFVPTTDPRFNGKRIVIGGDGRPRLEDQGQRREETKRAPNVPMSPPDVSSLLREVQGDGLPADARELKGDDVNAEHMVVDRHGAVLSVPNVRTRTGKPVYRRADGKLTTDIHGADLPRDELLVDSSGAVLDEYGNPAARKP